MSNKQLTDLARQMAETMNSMVEEAAQTRLKELIASINAGVPTSSKSAARTSVAAPSASTGGSRKKRNYVRKPCPVTGCKNLAAPRHSMVCTDHKDLTQREKDTYKAQAQAPGGAWYQETREKNAKRKAA